MDGARQALAFVARRQGQRSMPPAAWAHVMSLELGWMAPGAAKRYVAACHGAGLLASDGDALRLTFAPDTVEIRRGFRPDPDDLPRGGATGPGADPAGVSASAQEAAPDGPPPAPTSEPPGPPGVQHAPPSTSPPEADATPTGAKDPAQAAETQDAAPGEDLFASWLPRVAAARGEEPAATMDAVAAIQEAMGGALHAEAALLHLGRQAGLDVAEAARAALRRLMS